MPTDLQLKEPSLSLLPAQVDDFLRRATAWAASLGTDYESTVARLAATSVVVTTADDYQQVGGVILPDLANRQKVIAEFFAPFKNAAHRLHKMICDRENVLLKPLVAKEVDAKYNWQAYERDQQRRRRDDELRLAEVARRQEQDRLAAEAARLESVEPALARSMLEQALTVETPVVVLQAPPPIAGISSSENWKWRPVNGDAARAVDLVPRCFLCLDEKKLNAYAKANKGSARVPGLEFYDAGKVTVRA
jgi:hypothetical protein